MDYVVRRFNMLLSGKYKYLDGRMCVECYRKEKDVLMGDMLAGAAVLLLVQILGKGKARINVLN